MLPETTHTRLARLRRATRPHDARDHTYAACSLTSCSSNHAPETHLCGQPACVVFLGFMPPRHTYAASPPASCSSDHAPGFMPPRHTCAASPPASCSSDHAVDFMPPRHTCVASPPASCYSASCPRDTPVRPARLRRAPRLHAPETHLRGQPACVVLLGFMPPRHTCAASPPASCSSDHAPETHLRGPPACVVLLGSCPRLHVPETHLRGPLACVMLLGFMPPRHTYAARPPASCSSASCPRDTPAWPARLRRAPRLHAPETHLHGQPSCIVLLDFMPPRHTCAASPPASCSSATRPPRLRLRGQSSES
ncbi:uncharacterized protein LOC103973339 [Musa acuminata AAA Group]|uniref:uncharacterized protein LOC103973339 n=1 Tax=Musa acuminata AAA Group TaxID=214697 RepID=UPI0031E31154